MKNKPIFAIAYDFDGTLCPGSMQEHSFIGRTGVDPVEFWHRSNTEAAKLGADRTLMYMLHMMQAASAANMKLTQGLIHSSGKDITFFPGVQTWFDRIKICADENELDVRHFVISSGLTQMILGSNIGNLFERIFACEFKYNRKGVAQWPISAVNYTNKTQFIFRINKWALDLSDDLAVNNYIDPEKRPVPFRNMIFIGDGETDVPCMRTVKASGGTSISVFDPASDKAIKTSRNLLSQGRAHAAVPADYSEGSSLEALVMLAMRKANAEESMRLGLSKHG